MYRREFLILVISAGRLFDSVVFRETPGIVVQVLPPGDPLQTTSIDLFPRRTVCINRLCALSGVMLTRCDNVALDLIAAVRVRFEQRQIFRSPARRTGKLSISHEIFCVLYNGVTNNWFPFSIFRGFNRILADEPAICLRL